MRPRSCLPRTATPLHSQQNPSVPDHHRLQSSAKLEKRPSDESQSESDRADPLWQYYCLVSRHCQTPKVGLQQYRLREPASRSLRESGIYRNPALTLGQRLHLLEKCHVYDIEELRANRRNAYLQSLKERFIADFNCHRKYRLNDPRDFFTYEKFIQTPRSTIHSVNSGYLSSTRTPRTRTPSAHKNKITTRRSLSHSTHTARRPHTAIANGRSTSPRQPRSILKTGAPSSRPKP